MQKSPVLQFSFLLFLIISLFISAISVWNARIVLNKELEILDQQIAEDTIDQQNLQLRIEQDLEAKIDSRPGLEQIKVGEVIQAQDLIQNSQISEPVVT